MYLDGLLLILNADEAAEKFTLYLDVFNLDVRDLNNINKQNCDKWFQ